MAVTEAWDETNPAGSRDPRLGDDDIRQFKKALRERMDNGGHSWENPSGTDSEAGRHRCDPSTRKFTIYEDDGSTAAFEVDDNLLTITATSTYQLVGPRDTTMNIAIGGAATGRVPGVMVVNRGNGTLTLLEVQTQAFVAPAGAAFDLDINFFTVASGTNPLTTAGTSIFAAPGDHPTIAVGQFASAVKTAFSDATLAVGEAWVFDIDALNAAGGVVLTMKVRRS